MSHTSLTLTRRRGQKIVIKLPDGRDVYISPAEISGDRVRLNICAPADIRVDREEVDQARQRSQMQILPPEREIED